MTPVFSKGKHPETLRPRVTLNTGLPLVLAPPTHDVSDNPLLRKLRAKIAIFQRKPLIYKCFAKHARYMSVTSEPKQDKM